MELIRQRYRKNRPLINSVLFGIFYCLFSFSIELGDTAIGWFRAYMLFLPGVTFPLSTCYFNSKDSENNYLSISAHLFLSIGIYFGCVWIFSGYRDRSWLMWFPAIAGFVGSFSFHLITIILLKKKILAKKLILVSFLSGSVFIPYVFYSFRSWHFSYFLGLALFLWTIINGLLLNYEYKKSYFANKN